MKILGVSSNERTESISHMLLAEILSELSRYHEVRLLELSDTNKSIGCTGCFYCHDNKACISSQNREICLNIIESDILILSSPIYYGNINGLLKLFIDSTYSLKANDLEGKKVYFVGSSNQSGQAGIAVTSLLPWVVKNEMIYLGELLATGDGAIRNIEVKDFIGKINNELYEKYEAEIEFHKIVVLNQEHMMLSKYDVKKIK